MSLFFITRLPDRQSFCTHVLGLVVRRWHPDKAKGDKARAARKMREVSEAKEALTEQLRC